MDQLDRDLRELRRQVLLLATAGFTQEPDCHDQFDLLITHIEVNDRHGVGVLLGRLFHDAEKLIIVRSHTSFDGDDWIGDYHYRVSYGNLSRSQRFMKFGEVLKNKQIKRILCVPYHEDDVWSGIISQRMFDVPLCTYIMDDQNLMANGISDAALKELLHISSLRLAISSEMAAAYEQKYQLPFVVVPPIVSSDLISDRVGEPDEKLIHERVGVIVGNIWSKAWFERLRLVVRESKLKIDWYGERQQTWLNADIEAIQHDGIHYRGFLAQDELAEKLRKYPYGVVVTSNLGQNMQDETSQAQAIARFSIPSRISFMIATAHLPVIVVGSERTAAARFVDRHKIGLICSYDPQDFVKKVNEIINPSRRSEFRAHAKSVAKKLSSNGVRDWIWQSTYQGQPINQRFEDFEQSLAEDQRRKNIDVPAA